MPGDWLLRPQRRPERGRCGSSSERGWGYRADPAPAAPTPGARSLGSPQRRRRASAPRPSARFLFLPRESARTTRPGRAAAPGSPGQAVSGPGGRAGSGGRGGAADSPPVLSLTVDSRPRSRRLVAAESLISDLVACWGSRSRWGRVCAPPRPARAHVLTSGSGSAPLERPGAPCPRLVAVLTLRFWAPWSDPSPSVTR